eukprot:TRINITY_DN51492_c0_g1_i1.p1 TRINITY_DN51492_c0_g1~~TRINITY_DN51492_c0_g1_i1.p1  ORF type:complete len:813 (-),score=82.71 TRINITY_DN51492_c0_g1_i1:171-2609(-)
MSVRALHGTHEPLRDRPSSPASHLPRSFSNGDDVRYGGTGGRSLVVRDRRDDIRRTPYGDERIIPSAPLPQGDEDRLHVKFATDALGRPRDRTIEREREREREKDRERGHVSRSHSSEKVRGLTTPEDTPPREKKHKREKSGSDKLESEHDKKMIEAEEKFNREMEAARRKDLLDKQNTREKHFKARKATLDAMQDMSEEKGRILVELMEAREEQMHKKFHERLAEEQAISARREAELNTIIDELQWRLKEESHHTRTPVPIGTVRSSSGSAVKKPAPYLGLEIDDSRGGEQGLRVVAAHGPSGAGGLQQGDQISQITIPIRVHTRSDFQRAMEKLNPGDKVHFSVLRDGKTEPVFVTVGTRPNFDDPHQPKMIGMGSHHEHWMVPETIGTTTPPRSGPQRVYPPASTPPSTKPKPLYEEHRTASSAPLTSSGSTTLEKEEGEHVQPYRPTQQGWVYSGGRPVYGGGTTPPVSTTPPPSHYPVSQANRTQYQPRSILRQSADTPSESDGEIPINGPSNPSPGLVTRSGLDRDEILHGSRVTANTGVTPGGNKNVTFGYREEHPISPVVVMSPTPNEIAERRERDRNIRDIADDSSSEPSTPSPPPHRQIHQHPQPSAPPAQQAPGSNTTSPVKKIYYVIKGADGQEQQVSEDEVDVIVGQNGETYIYPKGNPPPGMAERRGITPTSELTNETPTPPPPQHVPPPQPRDELSRPNKPATPTPASTGGATANVPAGGRELWYVKKPDGSTVLVDPKTGQQVERAGGVRYVSSNGEPIAPGYTPHETPGNPDIQTPVKVQQPHGEEAEEDLGVEE